MSLQREILGETGRAMVEELFHHTPARQRRAEGTPCPRDPDTRHQGITIAQTAAGPPRLERHQRGHDYGMVCGRSTRPSGTREEQLRRAALGTIASRAGSPRVLTPRAAEQAVKTKRGHPVFPPHLASEEDDRLGADAGICCPTRYAENESTRHSQATATELTTPIPRTSMELTSERMGVWANALPVTTFDEAVNLCRWVHHGDAHAMAYLKWTITGLRDPAIRRSIGGVTLLQYQSQVIGRYKGVVEGAQVPRSKVTNVGHAPGTGFPLHDGPSASDIGTITPRIAGDEDVPMPRPLNGPTQEDTAPRACLGVAALNSDVRTCVHIPESPAKDRPGRDMASATMPEAIRWYREVPAAHWPIGMRPAPASTAPRPADISAWLTLNALAPARGELTALDRNRFLWKAVLIFSISGYFDHYVTIGQYPPDDLPLEHYPFETTTLRWSHVVSWITQHGILRGSAAVLALESFACSCCNLFLHNTDLECQRFDNEWPQSAEDVELTTLGTDDIPWIRRQRRDYTGPTNAIRSVHDGDKPYRGVEASGLRTRPGGEVYNCRDADEPGNLLAPTPSVALSNLTERIVKGLQEICAELKEEIEEGTFSLDDIEKDEATALINQLLEHRQLKKRGVRATTKAAQLDGFQTARRIGNALVDLYERTGIRGLAIFSCGCADDPGIPHAVDSDDSMEFLQQELDLPPLDFLRKFEHCTAEEPDDNGVNSSRKEVSRLVLEGLRQITKISTITMEWVNYEVAIHEVRGVELAGLLPDIPLSRPGTWNVETARRFRDGLRDGSIHWVTMTKTQHDELKAELNQRRAEMGAGALIKKAERSDKGKAHAKKNNAGKRAEVQAMGEGPSAVLAAARAATGAGTLLAAGTVRAEGTAFDTVGSVLPAGNATADIVNPQLINMPRDSKGLLTMLGDVPLLTMAELDKIELRMGTWFGPQPATPNMPSLLQTLGVTVATPAPPALPHISTPDALVTIETLLRPAETSTASVAPLRFISFSAAGNETTGSRKKRKRAPNGGAATGGEQVVAGIGGNDGPPPQKRRKRVDTGKSRAEWEAEKAAAKENIAALR
ncbi:hypothetical protein K438DRAFT_1769273 [Mycena galopus ATCC 62051]|nr:hypothetical protein K438DRAFT_1769273 [Mycena galopus ATCC 62051]